MGIPTCGNPGGILWECYGNFHMKELLSLVCFIDFYNIVSGNAEKSIILKLDCCRCVCLFVLIVLK